MVNIQELYQLYQQSYKVSTDTRKITKGCLFFALKGDNFNGNLFAEEALKKGASYAVVDEDVLKNNDNIILVDDVLKALQLLATYHREQLNIPIIGLTGSNGKTTTKELINAVLSTKYNTTATLGNLNNHIGVPLTLLSITTKTEIGIVEMGANHLKEIELLSNIAKPDYGYITNFGKAHLEGFGSLDGVIQGKTELYKNIKSRNKTVFININDAKQVEQSEGMNRVTLGNSGADYIIEFVTVDPFVRLKFNNILIKSNLIGAYNFNNISAAIAIGKHFKITDESIKEAIENYTPTNNRSQLINKGNNQIILDAYNANPSSMKVALENLSNLQEAGKIVILGDMFELGNDSLQEHQFITDQLDNINLEKAYLIGEGFYKTTTNSKRIQQFKNFEDFKDAFINANIENSTILIKASRGMALERVLDLL
ncbi:MAG: UDP-N-acetylmuramoyl-tripeptide--D-alanyl-D-alanine ligase [Flavobacteriaceae bacterium]|nr:UDP-N-acetylmuramoyl-tripeptide--D-alanyl-D-alanine ligase [Flavobacteriaceae bacterium]